MLDERKHIKNFRDIKESIVHSKYHTNENIPSNITPTYRFQPRVYPQ
jgi:hypothetical protein